MSLAILKNEEIEEHMDDVNDNPIHGGARKITTLGVKSKRKLLQYYNENPIP